MNPRWLMRMKRLVQNPPSAKRFYLFLVVLGLVLALFAYEYFVGVPDWMQRERVGPGRF